jgi:glycosyltransferase involved in cell wall biosynthesis
MPSGQIEDSLAPLHVDSRETGLRRARSDSPMRRAEIRVAVFYPWTGLPACDRGSARRIVPLINLLAEHYAAVKVLSPGNRRAVEQGNIDYRFLHPTTPERALLRLAHGLYDGILHHLSRGGITLRERRQWWHYLSARLQSSLFQRIDELVAWSSIAVLAFPFWDVAVRRACRRNHKNYLLTFDDVLSDLVTSNRWLKRRVSNCERRASRHAACVFSVSLHDQLRFSENGIATRVVPHGMATEPPLLEASSPPGNPELHDLEKARSEGAIVCLFVGSSLRCNQEGVEAIRKIAAAVVTRGNIQFVIAGACLPKRTYPHRVTALGPIEESVLLRLYQLTDIVLAPLISGTGTSLKVLEAFVHGKALLSTQVGVRGHPVQDGRDCVVCDDLEQYPEIILALSRDPAWRRELGESGRRFVKAFDYRVVYQPYLEEIEKFAR